MPTRWTKPLVGTSNRRRQRLTSEEWERDGRKDKIIALHRSGKNYEEIRMIMLEEYGLDASIASYKSRFKLWGLRDYFNEKQRRYILRERARRGRMPVFRYADTQEPVDKEKLERLWDSRYRYGGIPTDPSSSPGGLVASSPSPEYSGNISVSPELTFTEMLLDTPEDIDSEFSLYSASTISSRTSSSQSNDAISVQSDAGSNFLSCRSPKFPPKPLTYIDVALIEALMKIMEVLNVPLDYHLRRNKNLNRGTISIPKTGTIVRTRSSSSLPPRGAAARSELDNFSPMSPNSVEMFMSSPDMSNFLRQVSFQLCRIISPAYDIFTTTRTSGPKIHHVNNMDLDEITQSICGGDIRIVEKNIRGDMLTEMPVDADVASESLALLTADEYQRLSAAKEIVEEARKLSSEGHCEEASQKFQYALEKYNEILGQDAGATLDLHYETGLSLCGLPSDRSIRGKELLENLCPRLATKLGREHWHTRRSYNLLALFYEDNNKAMEILLLALNNRDITNTQTLIHSLDGTAVTTVRQIAKLHFLMGNNGTATSLRQMLLKWSIKHYGKHHAETNNYRSDLANSYHVAGMCDNALFLFRAALKSQQRIGFPPSREMISTQSSLAYRLTRLNLHEEAKQLSSDLHSALAPQLSSKGHLYYWRAFAYNSCTLGNIHGQLGGWKDAMYHYEAGVRVYSDVLGVPNHPNVGGTLSSICEAMLERGPVMYLKPLAFWLVDRREWGEEGAVSPKVVEWVKRNGDT